MNLRDERAAEGDTTNEGTQEERRLDACRSWIEGKGGEIVHVRGKTGGHRGKSNQRVKGSNELRQVGDFKFLGNGQPKSATAGDTGANLHQQFRSEVH